MRKKCECEEHSQGGLVRCERCESPAGFRIRRGRRVSSQRPMSIGQAAPYLQDDLARSDAMTGGAPPEARAACNAVRFRGAPCSAPKPRMENA
jgi:hypothetical protein